MLQLCDRLKRAARDDVFDRRCQFRSRQTVGLILDKGRRIDGEEGESRLGEVENVVPRFQMIRVSAPDVRPTFRADSALGRGQHLLRGALGARHLADRLLRENGKEVSLAAGRNVARRREAKPVSEAERTAETEQRGLREIRSGGGHGRLGRTEGPEGVTVAPSTTGIQSLRRPCEGGVKVCVPKVGYSQ